MKPDALLRELMECLVIIERLRRLVAKCNPEPEVADGVARSRA